MNMKAVRLRKIEPSDHPWLLELFKDVRRLEWDFLPLNEKEKESLFNVQQIAQMTYYKAKFPKARFEIVLFEDRPVGRLFTSSNETSIRIVDIAILTGFRRLGIGTCLLNKLKTECKGSLKTLHLKVERVNPARLLYQRLGFTIVCRQDRYEEMIWSPNPLTSIT